MHSSEQPSEFTAETITWEQWRESAREFRAYAETIRAQATLRYPYRPFILACTLFLEGETGLEIKEQIEAECEDWPHTKQQLQPILPLLRQIRRAATTKGWQFSLD